jgi:hypothetical protein
MSFVKEVHVSGELITSTWANKMETGVDEVTTGLDDASRMEVAGGTANALTLVMPSIKAYNLNKISFIGNLDNGGNATTLNINGLGAKPLYKSGGGNPKIANSKLYTCYYADWANCFFLEASAEGNTIASHVLAGDTYSSDSEVGAVGTMVNRAYDVYGGYTPAKSVKTDGAGNLVFEPYTGYYKEGLNGAMFGSILANDPDFIASNIVLNKDFFGLIGTFSKIYGVGDVISEDKLTPVLSEAWSKTDSGYPYAITVDLWDNVIIGHLSIGSKAVRKLNPSGVEIWVNSEVTNVSKIVTDLFGNIYIAYYADVKSVRKLNPSGVEIWSNSEIVDAVGIEIDPSQNVYVIYETFGATKSIRKLNSSGVEIWNLVGITVGSICIDDEGYIYTSSSSATRKFNSNGVEIWNVTAYSGPWGVAVNKIGDVFIAQTNGITKLNSSGALVWRNVELATVCRCITTDSLNNVYVSNEGSKSIRKLNSNGVEIWSDSAVTYGIALCVEGDTVYICNFGNTGIKNVRKFTNTKTFKLK